MRLKRNYFSALKRSSDWFFSRFKPLTVHTESIVIDSVWEKIREKINEGGILKWYVMTPANSDYFRSEFSIKMPNSNLSNLLKKRYKWMIENGEKLELHLHLSIIMENISYKEQEQLFKKAINWMKKEVGVVPREFVPGWWSYNKDTLALCKKYRLKMIHERDYDYIHDFDLLN